MAAYQNYVVSLTSKNALNGQGQYGGTITFPVSSSTMGQVQSFRIKQCLVENSYSNVTSIATDAGRGWYLSLDWVGSTFGAFTINVPPGNYSIEEILLLLQAQVLSITGTTIIAS